MVLERGFGPSLDKKLVRFSKINGISEYLQTHQIEIVSIDREIQPTNYRINYTVNNVDHTLNVPGKQIRFRGPRALVSTTCVFLLAIAKTHKLPLLFRIGSGQFIGSVARLKIARSYLSSTKVPTFYVEKTQIGTISDVSWKLLSTPEVENLAYLPLTPIVDRFDKKLDVGDVILHNNRPAIVEGWDGVTGKVRLNFGSSRTNTHLIKGYINASKMDVKSLTNGIMKRKLLSMK